MKLTDLETIVYKNIKNPVLIKTVINRAGKEFKETSDTQIKGAILQLIAYEYISIVFPNKIKRNRKVVIMKKRGDKCEIL